MIILYLVIYWSVYMEWIGLISVNLEEKIAQTVMEAPASVQM